jgi:aminodeoxyfutalosine synthase
MKHAALLESLGLANLAGAAEKGEAFTTHDLERVIATGNPLAAAALADLRRAAMSDDVTTYPVTLRVRVPGVAASSEDATRVSYPLDQVAEIDATEMEMVGELPADLSLAHAVELVRSCVAARPDLRLRAFTAEDVAAIARNERAPLQAVTAELVRAGLSCLDWRAGADRSDEAIRVHRSAHETGLLTFAPVTYSRTTSPAELLARLDALRDAAEAQRPSSFLSAVLVPERAEGASPLAGTSGTQDWLACALTRLALGHVVPHVTVDAHILGHKLAATLLSAGADDFVGAQAAIAWAPPTDDGPRPLNPARVTKYVIEARRSPVRRDGRFALLDSAG